MMFFRKPSRAHSGRAAHLEGLLIRFATDRNPNCRNRKGRAKSSAELTVGQVDRTGDADAIREFMRMMGL